MPLVARLKAGVDPSQARSAIASTYRSHMSLPVNVEFSRTRGQLREGTVQSAARGADRLRREYELPLQVLFGMVAVVLIIACVNVANLLLARAPARARDVAVRMAIGASRARIAGQLLTESMLLAASGGALGILLAAWGTELVSKLFRTGMRPIVIDVQPDGTVLIVTIVISLLTGLAFGLAPAWKTTAISLPMSLKVGGSARGGRRRFGQQGLVVLQVSLSLVLVFGAGLLARTLQNLRTIDGGFHKTAVVLFELDARDTAFPPERLEALCADVITRMKGRPEVLSGSCSTMSPIATNTEGRPVVVPGFAPRQDAPIVFANSIDGSYFETLGIEILRGRTFTPQDGSRAPLVAVISGGMAQVLLRRRRSDRPHVQLWPSRGRSADQDCGRGARRAATVARGAAADGIHALESTQRGRARAACRSQDVRADFGCRGCRT